MLDLNELGAGDNPGITVAIGNALVPFQVNLDG